MNKLALGGGLLAALGLGYFLTKKEAAAAAPSSPGGAPAPSPGEAPPAGGGLQLLADPLVFQKGRHYRGRLSLKPGDVPPFAAEATDVDLARGLKTLGFADIGVYMTPSELPQNWPKETADGVLPGTRWFEGTWPNETSSLPRPWQMEVVWLASPDDNPRLGKNRDMGKLTLA